MMLCTETKRTIFFLAKCKEILLLFERQETETKEKKTWKVENTLAGKKTFPVCSYTVFCH